jgi:hypothetical protein
MVEEGKVKLGRRRPPPGGKKLKLTHYTRIGQLPTPPASCDYSKAAKAVLDDVYLNDALGDCVIAGGYHVVGVETGNAGDLFHATADQITADYSAIGGYRPGDPSTDNGCDEQTALNYWTQNGFADGTKLTGWMAVDATNQDEAMLAMYLFENLYFGIELPDAWISPMPDSSGFIWDVGTPNVNNGHCVMGVGYDSQGVIIDTWGFLGKLTWAAIAALCVPSAGGELYTMVTPDQLAKGQTKAPNGIAWSDLLADFQSLRGGQAPSPVQQAVSLQDAQQWAANGLAENWPGGK